MSRMSAKFIGKEMGVSANSVYEIWEKMGLVEKGKLGDWILTDSGWKAGGKYSKNNYYPVPTFEFNMIIKEMKDFLNNFSCIDL